MRAEWQAAILLIATVLAGAATQAFHPRAPAWYLTEAPLAEDEVTPQMVQEKWQGKVFWIDARLRNEFEAGHIDGAILLNEQERDQLLFEHFERLQDNTLPVVVYCGLDTCQASRKMKDYLKERLPIAEIYVLKGGWESWRKANAQPTVPQHSLRQTSAHDAVERMSTFVRLSVVSGVPHDSP